MITDGEKHHLNSLHLEKKKYSGGYWSSQSFRLVLRCLWFCYIPTLWKTFCYGNIPNGSTPSLLNNERKRKEKEKKETKSLIKCVWFGRNHNQWGKILLQNNCPLKVLSLWNWECNANPAPWFLILRSFRI